MQTKDSLLKRFNLSSGSVLNRDELKKIIGGNGGEQCGPANGGQQCPAGECCSEYGFCGTTPEYCGSSAGSTCLFCTAEHGPAAGSSSCWYRKHASPGDAGAGEQCNLIYPNGAGQSYYAECASNCVMN